MADDELSVTIKGQGDRYREPWAVFRSGTVEGMLTLLEKAHEKDLFTAIGRAVDAFDRGSLMGAKLGARTIEVSNTEDVDKAAEQLAEEKPAEKPKAAPRSRAKAKPKAADEPEASAQELEAAADRPEPDKLAGGQPDPEEPAPAPKSKRKAPPAGVPRPAWMK